jgi:hypothetical protein
MSREMAITSLASLASLFGICYLLFWRYRSLRVDKFRQDMFELRDDLFDFAAAGNIDFNGRAYGILRSTMNGYIRHAHRMTLWHVIFLGLFVNQKDMDIIDTFDERWALANKRLPGEVKQKLEEFHARMEMLVTKHFFTAAPEFFILIPILLFILVVVGTVVACKQMASRSKKSLSADVWSKLRQSLRLNKIDDAALLYGEQVA